jgi:hypothetical protein
MSAVLFRFCACGLLFFTWYLILARKLHVLWCKCEFHAHATIPYKTDGDTTLCCAFHGACSTVSSTMCGEQGSGLRKGLQHVALDAAIHSVSTQHLLMFNDQSRYVALFMHVALCVLIPAWLLGDPLCIVLKVQVRACYFRLVRAIVTIPLSRYASILSALQSGHCLAYTPRWKLLMRSLCMVSACVDRAAVFAACASWFPACFTTASVPSHPRLFVTQTVDAYTPLRTLQALSHIIMAAVRLQNVLFHISGTQP